MGKRALRPGEFATVHRSMERQGALMFASPEEKFNGSAMGHFTFGMYLASAHELVTHWSPSIKRLVV